MSRRRPQIAPFFVSPVSLMAKSLVAGSLVAGSLIVMSACTETPDAKPAATETPASPSTMPASGGGHGDHAAGTAMPPSEGPFFAMPSDGSQVTETFTVVMGVVGKKVTPAGTAVEDKSQGHHHIIIDGEPVAKGIPVPADATHIHFCKGQTETTLTLAPGKHSLTLQFADGAHISYGPELAKTISVEVKAGGKERGVSFVEPVDGATVKSPVAMKFAVSGMTVRPAGEDALDKTSGHHHVVIDGKPVTAGLTVPADKTHIHYGKGQTEASVELTPGKHTLTLQFADGTHASYGESMSQTINVTVE